MGRQRLYCSLYFQLEFINPPKWRSIIEATAFDLAGNTSKASVSVIVDNDDTDIVAPTISITDPADGATVTGTVQIAAEAFDSMGVEKVTFAVDGQWVGRDFTAPYTFSWNTITHANGIAKAQATAFDHAGNTTTNTIFVSVSN